VRRWHSAHSFTMGVVCYDGSCEGDEGSSTPSQLPLVVSVGLESAVVIVGVFRLACANTTRLLTASNTHTSSSGSHCGDRYWWHTRVLGVAASPRTRITFVVRRGAAHGGACPQAGAACSKERREQFVGVIVTPNYDALTWAIREVASVRLLTFVAWRRRLAHFSSLVSREFRPRRWGPYAGGPPAGTTSTPRNTPCCLG
jgi:hypothetical protein